MLLYVIVFMPHEINNYKLNIHLNNAEVHMLYCLTSGR